MLANKLAIVTGGASGIGKAVAKLFVKNGASIALVDLTNSDEIRAQIEKEVTSDNLLKGLTISNHKCDVSKSIEVNNLFNEIKVHHHT